jgi:hypothetical protein
MMMKITTIIRAHIVEKNENQTIFILLARTWRIKHPASF